MFGFSEMDMATPCVDVLKGNLTKFWSYPIINGIQTYQVSAQSPLNIEPSEQLTQNSTVDCLVQWLSVVLPLSGKVMKPTSYAQHSLYVLITSQLRQDLTVENTKVVERGFGLIRIHNISVDWIRLEVSIGSAVDQYLFLGHELAWYVSVSVSVSVSQNTKF